MPSQRTQCIGCLLILGGLLVGCASESPPPAPLTTPATMPAAVNQGRVTPQFAYAAGLDFGQRVSQQLKADGVAVDTDLIVQGVRDGLTGSPPRYSQDQMDDAIGRIEAAIWSRRAQKQYAADPSFRKMADENLKNSREGIARYAMLAGVETDPSGILIDVLQPGSGRYVANATRVAMNLELSLMDGVLLQKTEPGSPHAMPLVQMPPAMAEVIRGMRVGEKARMAIPADKAYGLAGRPPLIGPNQALLVDLEIVSAN